MSPSKIVRILDPKCRSNVCETVKSVSGAVKMAQEGKKSLTAGTSDCLIVCIYTIYVNAYIDANILNMLTDGLWIIPLPPKLEGGHGCSPHCWGAQSSEMPRITFSSLRGTSSDNP